MHQLPVNKPESGGETLFPRQNGETCCHLLTQAVTKRLSVPADRVTLKYHLLSYVSPIKGQITCQCWEVAACVSSCYVSIQFTFGGCENRWWCSVETVDWFCCYHSGLINWRKESKWFKCEQQQCRVRLEKHSLKRCVYFSNLKAELEPRAYGHYSW